MNKSTAEAVLANANNKFLQLLVNIVKINVHFVWDCTADMFGNEIQNKLLPRSVSLSQNLPTVNIAHCKAKWKTDSRFALLNLVD